MSKKRYRSIYDALDDVLMGSMDTKGVKSAKERYQEQKAKQARPTPPNQLTPGEEARAAKIRKLQAIIDDQAASQGEKDNAQRLLEKIKNKG